MPERFKYAELKSNGKPLLVRMIFAALSASVHYPDKLVTTKVSTAERYQFSVSYSFSQHCSNHLEALLKKMVRGT